MSIALYDADYIKYGIERPYSYNLMKLAAYYKKKREVVRLITDLSRSDLYTKVYYNQDYPGLINTEIAKHSNITLCGFQISGGRSMILSDEIMKCPCDTSIYPPPAGYENMAHKRQNRYGALAKSHNILLSSNEISIPNFQELVIFHDINIFNIPDWLSRAHEKLKDDKGRPVVFANKIPQYVNNYNDLLGLATFGFSRYYSYIYTDMFLDMDKFGEYLDSCVGQLPTVNYFAINTQEKYTKQELIQLEIEVMRRNFFAKQHSKDFLLYNKGLCENPNLDSFFDLFITWNNTLFRLPHDRRQSFYEYIGDVHTRTTNKSKYIVRELFNQVVDLKTYAKIDIAKIIEDGGVFPL